MNSVYLWYRKVYKYLLTTENRLIYRKADRRLSTKAIFLKKILMVFLIIMLILSLYKAGEAKMGGEDKEIIEEKCLRCHNMQRIVFFKRTPQEWSVIVRRMKEKCRKCLSDEEEADCLRYLTLNYVKTGKDFFETLCVSCHATAGNTQLLYQRKTISGWSRAIERMRRKYGFLIGVTAAEQINAFWTGSGNNKNLKLNIEETDLIEGVFEDKCGRCHTYNFMYTQKRTKQDWLEILSRMQEKSPLWIIYQDLEQIKKYIFSNEKVRLD